MRASKIIGISLIIISIAVIGFGIWLKSYNDKIAQVQVNESGSCYLPDGTCIHAISDTMLYLSVGIAIVLAIIGAYIFLRKEPLISAKVQTKSVDHVNSEENLPTNAKNLSSENKIIYDLVVQSNGAILQGELIKKSGMDKVKVSRVLDKLEMLGLIERRRHGMSNLVVLKKTQ
jgi:uncharacterized membrane protein